MTEPKMLALLVLILSGHTAAWYEETYPDYQGYTDEIQDKEYGNNVLLLSSYVLMFPQ